MLRTDSNNPIPQFDPRLSRAILTNAFGFDSGEGIKVAVLDSGVRDIPALSGITRIDMLDEHGTGMDKIDHGTRVAAIIKHFAKGADITSIKITNDGNIRWEDFTNGLDRAVDEGAHIVNMSLEFPHSKDFCTGDCDACLAVWEVVEKTDIIVVAAVGNAGPDENSVRAPAMAQNVISVGSLSQNGTQVAHFSGRGILGVKKPNILTSGYVWHYGICIPGTSFATPVVTGVLAAGIGAYPKEKNRIIEALYNAGIPLPNVEMHHQGNGVLSLERFVEEVVKDEANVSQSQ